MSICPYPKCEYNDSPRCGVNYCILPVCLCPAACSQAITDEINRIIALPDYPGKSEKLEALKAEQERTERLS